MKKILAILMAMMMLLSLISCGTTKTEEPAEEPAAETEAPAEEAAEEPAEEPAEEAAEVTVVKIGISNDSMPNCYLDAEGNLAGENYEVMCLVDEMLPEYQFEYEPLTQDVILTGMDTGTYAVGIFNAFYNDERAEKYLFPTYPVSGGLRGLILNSEMKESITGGDVEAVLDQFAALELTMVPVSPGDSSDTTYAEYNETHDPKIKYEAVEEIDVATSIRYIMEGRYDGAMFLMSNYTTVNNDVDPEGNTFFLPFEDGGFGTWILYAKGQEELVAAVDSCMAELYADGTMAAISQKYYGENVFQYIDGFEFASVEPKADYQ